MLQKLLLTLLIVDSFVLAAAVLLQSGKGTGMAASFGGVSSSPDAFIGTRQAGNLLTKIDWWSGGILSRDCARCCRSRRRARAFRSRCWTRRSRHRPRHPATPAPASAAPGPSVPAGAVRCSWAQHRVPRRRPLRHPRPRRPLPQGPSSSAAGTAPRDGSRRAAPAGRRSHRRGRRPAAESASQRRRPRSSGSHLSSRGDVMAGMQW